MKISKTLIAAFVIILSVTPAFAKDKITKKQTTEKNSLIGKTKITDKISVGNDYEPSQYPKSSYSLGTDGLYHFNPAARKD